VNNIINEEDSRRVQAQCMGGKAQKSPVISGGAKAWSYLAI
jgi:hypothetical protein